MDFVCSISGTKVYEHQGVLYKSLRPAVQDFIKTIKQDIGDDSYISYTALNELMRAYVATLTAEEIRSHQALALKVQERYDNDEVLKPINPNIEPVAPTFGERLADRIADFGGSWKFIIIFLSILVGWMAMNVVFLYNKGFDPYPFILLNLVLSCIAALQAPVIMMSQNRQEEKDRMRSENDYLINLKAEIGIRSLHQKMDLLLGEQIKTLYEMQAKQFAMLQDIEAKLEMKKDISYY